jgi:HK97 family phage major capsid protein
MPQDSHMLTRKTLIDTLRANGFKAEATLETVKSFVASLASEGIDLNDENGNPIDVDAAWNAKSVLKISGTPDLDAVTKSTIHAAKGSTSPHADGAVEDRSPQRFNIGNTHRKAYERKVAAGTAVFNDYDEAMTFKAWTRLTVAGQYDYPAKAADIQLCKKGQVEYNQQLGGALVPQVFVPQLIYLTEQYGAAKRLANVVPMSNESSVYPRKTGITSMTPSGEGATTTVTDNSYGNVTLTAKKYAVLMSMSNELFNDSAINVPDDIARTIAEAEAIAIDSAYFLGNGTSTYAGQVGLAGALPTAAYITAATWASITKDHFALLMGAVENVNAARLKFATTRQFFVQVMMRLDKATSQFKDISTGNLGGGTFMGYDVVFAQVMPTVAAASATHFPCYFGDFEGGSMIGDRQMLSIATSEHALFSSDSIAVRGTSRFNVNIHGDGRGSTYGPIVGFKTA